MTNILKAFEFLDMFTRIQDLEFQAEQGSMHRVKLTALTNRNFNFEEFQNLHTLLDCARQEYRLIGEQLKWGDRDGT